MMTCVLSNSVLVEIVNQFIDPDYVLHHIRLETLLLGGREEEEKEEEPKIGDNRDRKEREGKEKREEMTIAAEDQGSNVKKEKEEETQEKVDGLRDRVFSLVREFGGVQLHVVAKKLGAHLARVSEAAKMLKEEGLIKVARNVPYISSLRKPNAIYYLDAEKQTALHDAVMNMNWEWNTPELGGRSSDHILQYGGKTWNTDGLLENTGGSFIVECVTGNYEKRIIEQLEADSTQVGNRSIRV